MFLLAKLHPRLEETEQEGYQGDWLSRAAKERVVNRFYQEKQRIPLCIDHRDIGAFGHVKEGNRVGQVKDLFINGQGELMMSCELFNHHRAAYKEVNQGIFRDKKLWGVSVGMANTKRGDGTKSRNLVHVALTSDPAFAAHDTFVTHWGLNEKKLNKVIAGQMKGDGLYRPELLHKLEGVKDFLFP